MDDVAAWFKLPNTGSVETAAAPFWRLVPNVRSVTVRRPVDEVVESIRKLVQLNSWDGFAHYMQRLSNKLDQIEKRVPNVLRVTYDELQTEAACQAVFEHCLPYQHDSAWWQAMAPINLQCHFHHIMLYMQVYEPQLVKLAKIAKHKMMADISRQMNVEHDDGFVFREETMATMFPDAQRLFEDHCVLVGESPDNFMGKNLGMFKRLEDVGNLQIMTARANGRMFGYLVTILAPSLESPDITVATQTTFFTDPTCKGLGMRLQRAAVERLREKGINEAYFHAGVRGSGPRIGSLYKRIGAQPYGEWYKLNL